MFGFVALLTFSSHAQVLGTTGNGYRLETALTNAASQCHGHKSIELMSIKNHGNYYSLDVICKDQVSESDFILKTVVGIGQDFSRAVENAKFQCESDSIKVIGQYKNSSGIVRALSICD